MLVLGQVAAAQTWQQAAVSVGTAGEYRVESTAADAAGNVYITGSFSGTVRFGNSVLTSASGFGYNAFVAKWSSATKAFAWGQQVTGTGSDFGTAVAVQGNAVYVAGYFYSTTAGFGAISLANAGNHSTSDLFVAKLLDAGTSASFVWAQRAGGSNSETETGLVVNGSNVYVAGTFVTSASFGSSVLTSAGSTDVFVAKLNDAGNTASFSWAQLAGGTGDEAVYGLAAQGTNLYITGYFTGPTASFGPATIANASKPSNFDVFVAKLVDAGSSGSFVWAQQAGSTARDIGYAVAVSGTSVYVAGVFEAPTGSFGNLTLTATTTTNSDAFVAKLTDAGSTGSFVWVRQVGGPGYELPMGLAATGAAVYLGGYFGGPTATLGSTTLTTAGKNDLFVARLTDAGPTGSYSWVQQAGGIDNDYLSSLVAVGTTVYVGGALTMPASFGSLQLTGPNPAVSIFTGYWAQLTDTFQPLAAAAPVAASNALSVYPNPARTAATVRIAAPMGTAPATLTLLGVTGQVIHTQQVALPTAEAVATLPLAGLAPGLYHVQVQAGSWHSSQALVVE